MKIEAILLYKTITNCTFNFLACLMNKVLGLMVPANTTLQAEETHLIPGVKLIQSASSCIADLWSDGEFLKCGLLIVEMQM